MRLIGDECGICASCGVVQSVQKAADILSRVDWTKRGRVLPVVVAEEKTP